ncbi:MAG: hypothetical protein OHK0050_42540 [Roseiflexaceae bacterium]
MLRRIIRGLLPLLFVLCSIPVSVYAQATTGRWEDTSAQVAGQTLPIRVYLPAEYPNAGPYSVAYLLPGLGEPVTMWDTPDMRRLADQANIVLVAIPGTLNEIPAWYSRSANLPQPDGSAWPVSFYDWLFEGVIPLIEQQYQVRADADGRILIGFSMGGKGALSLAAMHPDRFAIAVSLSGVTDLLAFAALQPNAGLAGVYGDPVTQAIRYAAETPLELAPNLSTVRVILIHGADDQTVPLAQAEQLHLRLEQLGIAHFWQPVAGLGHAATPTELEQAFAQIQQSLQTPRQAPASWSYRIADTTTRTVYKTTIRKTDPLTWTTLLDLQPTGFRSESGDPFELTTAPHYLPNSPATITLLAADGTNQQRQLLSDAEGRLTLTLPAGRIEVRIEAGQPIPVASPTPASLLDQKLAPVAPPAGQPLQPTGAVADSTALPTIPPEGVAVATSQPFAPAATNMPVVATPFNTSNASTAPQPSSSPSSPPWTGVIVLLLLGMVAIFFINRLRKR